MIIIISPAKSMDFNSEAPSSKSSNLDITTKTSSLINKLQSLSANQLAKIMNVSKKIADLNYERFQTYRISPEKPAIFAYTGDVYKNIDTQTLSPEVLEFGQDHLRIVSALYGLLRPLDKIKAYRLEMVTRIPGIAPKGLASFWKKQITGQLNTELANHQNKFLINIASNEYAAVIDKASLNVQMINIHFREIRDGKVKNIALNSKRARGMLADYIIRNELDSPEDIKSFNKGGHRLNQTMSDFSNFFFTRSALSNQVL